jgi:hypothetical protein
MKSRISLFVALFVAMTFVPGVALGQFGGLGKKKNKFNVKPVKKLIKDIDVVVKDYNEATENVWTATETVQNTIKPYAEGEFPALTNTWGEIRKSIKEAKDDTAKAAAVELSDKYIIEMIERKKKIEELMKDPVKTADLQSKLQVPEIENLKTIVANLKPVPEKDAKLIAEAPELAKKSTETIAKLTKQITKTPLKAADYKKLIKKLKKANVKLLKIPEELKKQVEAINVMMANIAKLIEGK